jgi:hypothetical protein
VAITTLIGEAAARGASLTSNLLAFSCGQPSQVSDVDVASMLADAARLLRPTLGEQIAVSAKPVVGVQLVRADPSRLMAAILNLAILARDAMPRGGKLGFEANAPCEAGFRRDHRQRLRLRRHSRSAVPAFADLGAIEDFVRQSGRPSRGQRRSRSRNRQSRIYLPRAAGAIRSQPEATDSLPRSQRDVRNFPGRRGRKIPRIAEIVALQQLVSRRRGQSVLKSFGGLIRVSGYLYGVGI